MRRRIPRWPTCRRCGSDLTVRSKTARWGESIVAIYECRCGSSKRVPLEVSHG